MGGIIAGHLPDRRGRGTLKSTHVTPEQGGSMARKIGMRTMALGALLGSAAIVVEMVHRTLNLNW
jgi:hypothetical protein